MRILRHKATEVSRGHSTSEFFFLREGLNIRVLHRNCKISVKARTTATPFFLGNGLLPEARAAPEVMVGELSRTLRRGKMRIEEQW